MVRNVAVPAESSVVKVVLRSPPLKSLFTNGRFVNKDHWSHLLRNTHVFLTKGIVRISNTRRWAFSG
jgi:hypothetical protein